MKKAKAKKTTTTTTVNPYYGLSNTVYRALRAAQQAGGGPVMTAAKITNAVTAHMVAAGVSDRIPR